MKKCKICNIEIKNRNKIYCSAKCRYSDSHFKHHTPWNKGLTAETSELLKAIGKKTSKKLKGRKPWNTGLTRETSESMRAISKKMSGTNNSVFKIKDRNSWKKNISNSLKGENTGTLEAKHGEAKARIIKEKQSTSAKNRKIHGHAGFRHSEESKQKMREATVKRISNGEFNIFTEPMKRFKKILNELKISFEIEYNFMNFSIDFADVENKIAFEVDGDFWHCNPKKYPKGPIYECQKRNARYDKNKNTFLAKNGWVVLRFWEDAIYNNREEVKNRIKQIYEII